MIGILGFPWAAAAIYAGWERLPWLAAILVGVGGVLYVMLRPTILTAHFQRSPVGTLVMLIVTQGITVAILYGIGFGLEAVFG